MRPGPLRLARLAVTLLVAGATLLGPAGPAGADAGPELTSSAAQLSGSLTCPDDLAPGRPAVLLVHGTGLDGRTNWSWNYAPALIAAGWQVCTVDLLGFGLADVQVSAERVVHGIRTVAAAVGGPVGVVGYSQGGILGRYVLAHWPDLPDLVDDLVLLATPTRGSAVFDEQCRRTCPAAFWQFGTGSRFMAAVAALGPAPAGVDVTSIGSATDDVLVPDAAGLLTEVPGATNVVVQDRCPDDEADHLEVGTTDPVAYALTLDALTHPGPAELGRIGSTPCADPLPGLTAERAQAELTRARQVAAARYLDAQLVRSEPPLRCLDPSGTCTEAPEGAAGTTDPTVEGDGDDGAPTGLLVATGAVVAGAVWVVTRARRPR